MLFAFCSSIWLQFAGLFDRRVLGRFCLIFLCLFGELPSPFAMLPRHMRNSLVSFLPAKVHKINFCVMIGHVSSFGSPCPATEWTLCLFATFLDDSLRHSSIKMYLSALRPLHADQGFPDPLENCLRLQRVVRGVECSQGYFPANPCLPVSSNILHIHELIWVWTLTHFDDHKLCFGLPVYWLILVF